MPKAVGFRSGTRQSISHECNMELLGYYSQFIVLVFLILCCTLTPSLPALYICFHIPSFVAIALECSCTAIKTGLSNSTAEPSPYPPLCLLFGITDLPFLLSRSLIPLSLSPPSFSLRVSPNVLNTERSSTDAFSPTCLYLQITAKGEQSLSFFFSPYSGFDFTTTSLAPASGLGFLVEYKLAPQLSFCNYLSFTVSPLCQDSTAKLPWEVNRWWIFQPFSVESGISTDEHTPADSARAFENQIITQFC